MFCGGCLVNLNYILKTYIFASIDIIIFRHLELEIALAIPASNDEK